MVPVFFSLHHTLTPPQTSQVMDIKMQLEKWAFLFCEKSGWFSLFQRDISFITKLFLSIPALLPISFFRFFEKHDFFSEFLDFLTISQPFLNIFDLPYKRYI